MPRDFSPPWLRRSVFDDRHEKNTHSQQQQSITWFFRATAIASSWVALAGYTFFTITLTAPAEELKWRQDVLGALGGIGLASGYTGAFIAFIFCRSATFRLDCILLPLLLSSVGGLFEFVLNYVLHSTVPVSGAYIYVPLVTGCVATLFLAGAAMFLNTSINIRRSIEKSRKTHMELSPDPSTLLFRTTTNTTNNNNDDGRAPSIFAEPPSSAISASSLPFLSHHNNNATTHPAYQAFAPLSAISPLSTIPLPPPLRHMTSTEIHDAELNVPEDEAQRRQLLRLLIAREQQEDTQKQDGSTANEPSGASSTYRIDWPGADSSDDENVYGLSKEEKEFTRSRNSLRGRDTGESPEGSGGTTKVDLHFPPPPTDANSPTTKNRWNLGNLLGGAGRKPQLQQMDTSTTTGTAGSPSRASAVAEIKMERERRRKEIERSSLHEKGWVSESAFEERLTG